MTKRSDTLETALLIAEQLKITGTVLDGAMLEWWLRELGDAVSHLH